MPKVNKTFSDYLLDNIHKQRKPSKISIEFTHKRFSDNKGFAVLNDPVLINEIFNAITEIAIKSERV